VSTPVSVLLRPATVNRELVWDFVPLSERAGAVVAHIIMNAEIEAAVHTYGERATFRLKAQAAIRLAKRLRDYNVVITDNEEIFIR
jgi:hypothetical protein